MSAVTRPRQPVTPVVVALTLPLPPGVNNQYLSIGRRRVLSRPAQAFNRDVLKAVAEGFRADARVADRMTRHPETVESADATDHAAALMIHGGFRHLPVVDGEEVVGILSIRDLMRVALEDRAPRGV